MSKNVKNETFRETITKSNPTSQVTNNVYHPSRSNVFQYDGRARPVQKHGSNDRSLARSAQGKPLHGLDYHGR